jgi:hypothetical protein
VKVLVVMKHRGDAGNTHAVANYMRLAPKHGHTVAIFGTPIWYVRELQFSMDVRGFDRVVYVYESELYRIKRLNEAVILARFPKHQRLIMDTDGMYNPLITVDGYDFNHASEAERMRWIAHLDALGGRIMQTTIAPPTSPRVGAMPFYGYNPQLQLKPAMAPPKQFDVLHLGHNWWRWREVSRELLPALEQIRAEIGRIAFVGLWWDAPPVEGLAAGPAEAFVSDPDWLRRLRIETPKAVLYHDVIRTMSMARINIMTQRPVLRRLKHLTLKYFEVFCADTIPLLMLDAEHAQAVYGPAGRELSLPGAVADKVLDALRRPDHYRGVVEDVRRHLIANYAYDRQVEALFTVLQS